MVTKLGDRLRAHGALSEFDIAVVESSINALSYGLAVAHQENLIHMPNMPRGDIEDALHKVALAMLDSFIVQADAYYTRKRGR